MEVQVRAEYDGSPEEREAQRAELERRDDERLRRLVERRKEAYLRSRVLSTVEALRRAGSR